MTRSEYKKILEEIFDILGFSVAEKAQALETFKKKMAFELLKSIEKELPQEQQDWLADPKMNQADPRLPEIQKMIQGMYSEEQLYEKSRSIFKTMLDDYIDFMAEKLDPEETQKLKEIADRLE